MHHAIADGWSIGILIRELSALYQSFLLGRAVSAPGARRSSTPITRSGSGTGSRAQVLQRQLDYWTKQLAGVSDLELPTDRPRPPLSSQRGDERSTTLPKATLEAVRATRSTRGRDAVHDAAGRV